MRLILSRLIALTAVTTLNLAGAAFSYAQPSANVNDDLFLEARQAANKGNAARLDKLAQTLEGYELAPYVEYWRIAPQLKDMKDIDAETVRARLASWRDTYLGDRLRGDWLRVLGKQGAWADFDSEFPFLASPDQDLNCYALQSRLTKRNTDAKDRSSALDEALSLWKNTVETPEACIPVLDAVVREKKVFTDDVWSRARRQIEANRLGDAKFTLRYLPAGQGIDSKTLELALEKAPIFLAKQPSGWETERSRRELAAIAIGRIARSDPRQAADSLMKIRGSLQPNELAWAWGQIGWQGALRQMPEASAWFAGSSSTTLSDEAQQWKARAALREGNWREVRATIEKMPPALAEKADWVYWLGRAYKAEGLNDQARALFTRITGQANFYGNLADDELGRAITIPPPPSPPTAEELARAENNASLRRAFTFFRLGLRYEAVREWNWGIRSMNDRELLAAACVANNNDIYDRAINTADKTRTEHDFALRYLAPFHQEVKKATREQGLDDAWVYGLIRQESRFVTNARSSANASGLMQLMPKTAQWVAKKIGLKDYHPGQVNDRETNLTLGTNYLRMVFESLDNHPILASAAYNAGPGRARKWRGSAPLEGAIYAETIPFNETRDYVKKVMSNTVYYAALFEGKPQSLKPRLGVITPAGREAAKAVDLP